MLSPHDKLVRTLIRSQFERWKHLRAWGGACDRCTLDMAGPRRTRLGQCHFDGTIEVNTRPGQPLACAFKTLIHEFAHAAAPSHCWHEQPWREVFAAGCLEATGHGVEIIANVHAMGAQVERAIGLWIADGSPSPEEIARRAVASGNSLTGVSRLQLPVSTQARRS